MTTSYPHLADLIRGDFHVHSTYSDDAQSSLEENLLAANDTALTHIRMVDHVRTSTTWVPEFTAHVRRLPRPAGLQITCGVEAKLLNSRGELDLPTDLTFGPHGIDAVLIADHQFPGPDGPWSPSQTMAEIAAGLPVTAVIDTLIDATVKAMVRYPISQLAHLFSLLPKIGLSESDVTTEHLTALAQTAATNGVVIEINEKWRCPGPVARRIFIAAGVTLVASSDSHQSAEIGHYDWVRAHAAAEDRAG